jgi:hypothetical protein
MPAAPSPEASHDATAEVAAPSRASDASRDTGVVVGEPSGSAPYLDASLVEHAADLVDAAALEAGDARPRCASALCEDFESGKLDPLVWSAQATRGQTVVVESDLAAHGRYAARFHALPDVVSYDFIITKNAPVALRGHHHGRAYFFVTPRPPAQHMELLFAGSTGFPDLKYLEVATIGEAWQLTFVQQVAPTGESYKAAAGAVPLAAWSCLQWEMNDTPDQISLTVDGATPIVFGDITFAGKNTGLVGGFADFGFGFYIWHPVSYPFDVYLDDIALDAAPIACLPR